LQSEKVTSAASIPDPKKKKKTKNSNNGKRLEMEKIVARKILSQQKYATFKLLQTQKSHAQHTIFHNASKGAKNDYRKSNQ
jgi:hypothetical protein